MQPEPLPKPTADLAQAMVGIWRLQSREDYDGSGRRVIDPILGADPLGILSFSPTHFAAQFMRRDRGAEGAGSGPAVAAPPAVPASNNSVASNGYDAYFGTYEMDASAGLVTIRLEGAITPSNIGHTMTRELRVAGNRLFIRLDTNTPDGVPITRTLTFERV